MAQTALYHFVDDAGVPHYSNLQIDARYQPFNGVSAAAAPTPASDRALPRAPRTPSGTPVELEVYVPARGEALPPLTPTAPIPGATPAPPPAQAAAPPPATPPAQTQGSTQPVAGEGRQQADAPAPEPEIPFGESPSDK